METNSVRRFNNLDAMRADFDAYPAFWYQIGSTANSIFRSETDKERQNYYRERAIECFKKYVKDCDKILENDPNSYYRIKESINQYSAYLKNIVNSDDKDGHTENQYEAKKTLDELNKLSTLLDIKFDKAKRKYSMVKESSHQYGEDYLKMYAEESGPQISDHWGFIGGS